MANPKSTPTMNEVAKEAKTSVATVSRVINGNQPVSPALEARVRKAMKKLHYHPSALARNLKQKSSNIVGVLIPILEHPAYSRMASAIERSLFKHGYRAIICNSEEDEDRENTYIEMLLRQRVGGIIIDSSARTPEYINELQENRMPIVLFDRNLEDVTCHQVFCDNSQGGYMGMEYLSQLGHKRIGIIAAPTYPEAMSRRIEGTQEAIQVFNLDNSPELLIKGDTQLFDMGYKAGCELLRLNPRPTAIFALTDVTAVGVMHAARELEISVPDELSIIGYDDIPIASYMLPSLTTIMQPLVEMGETAVDFLIKSMEEPEAKPEKAVLSTKLIVRQTTAPPK